MATKHNLTHAEQVYVGAGYDAGVFGRNERKGIPVSFMTRVTLGSPAVADADLLIVAATSAELPNNATITYTPATNGTTPTDNAAAEVETITTSTGASALVWTLDAARNLAATSTVAVADTVFTFTGYDIYGVKMVEAITIAATASAAVGKKAFKYVESIAIYSAGNITTDIVEVGTGSILGLPYRLTGTGEFLQASRAGVREATFPTVVKADATAVSATTGDVRGTILLSAALNGGEIVGYFVVTDPNTPVGLRGLAQFAG